VCAIIDINVIHELWDNTGTLAGQGFRRFVEDGKVPVVIGGSILRNEIGGSSNRMQIWIQQMILGGHITKRGEDVDKATRQLKSASKGTSDACVSNDHHIIALAIVSGARLLYTNDQKLQKDFCNTNLISNPRGKVYSTKRTSDFSASRRRLLNNRQLCKPTLPNQPS